MLYAGGWAAMPVLSHSPVRMMTVPNAPPARPASLPSLAVKYYNPVSGLCVVRCSKDEHERVSVNGRCVVRGG